MISKHDKFHPQFPIKSGSSYVYIINDGNSKIIKKIIFRKAKEKFNKEIKALTLLKDGKHFPKIIKTNKDDFSIYMTYCGERISFNNIPSDWELQVDNIINFINKINIVHGDIYPENICIYNNLIYLIDWGNIRSFGDSFFLQNDFKQYRQKQHNKLYKICYDIQKIKKSMEKI